MKSFSLCQEVCPELIPVIPAEKLGDGADGEVFAIAGFPDRVIKFSILYDYPYAPVEVESKRIDHVLSFLEETHPDTCAYVYSHKFLATGSRDTVSDKQKYILYYYIMEKCVKISDDEKKVFHSILSHEDRRIEKKYSRRKIEEMLQGLSFGLDFDKEKILSFYDGLSNNDFNHLDIHPRNIMKDINGFFKLIDFDRSKIGEAI